MKNKINKIGIDCEYFTGYASFDTPIDNGSNSKDTLPFKVVEARLKENNLEILDLKADTKINEEELKFGSFDNYTGITLRSYIESKVSKELVVINANCVSIIAVGDYELTNDDYDYINNNIKQKFKVIDLKNNEKIMISINYSEKENITSDFTKYNASIIDLNQLEENKSEMEQHINLINYGISLLLSDIKIEQFKSNIGGMDNDSKS